LKEEKGIVALAHREVIFLPFKGVNLLPLPSDQLLVSVRQFIPEHKG